MQNNAQTNKKEQKRLAAKFRLLKKREAEKQKRYELAGCIENYR